MKTLGRNMKPLTKQERREVNNSMRLLTKSIVSQQKFFYEKGIRATTTEVFHTEGDLFEKAELTLPYSLQSRNLLLT